ncbi:unnamed protein product [Symbiodinium necroappetens]|uniref:Uncharacterized protein n=1 Tax=Symbiodinium necroappetens TaxID=1628268 RepID=A0A812IV01_9DINO|nr:unnamed protein product [Symbiodinium necroappetens]
MSRGGDGSEEDESQGSPVSGRISELSTVLDAQRLRGVPLHWALQLRHWTNVEGQVGQATAAKNYSDLSRPVKALDAFVSHDWASSGLLKVLSLLIVYNSGAAFCTSLVVSILVGVLRGFGRLPNEHWTVVFGIFSFFVVFGFWQQLRRPFRRPAMVFVDKMCIAQHDASLKRHGIMGMPAFLLNSEDLIILFTSNYCKRLWCCFEMATFLKDVPRQRKMLIMPLKTAQLLCLASGIWFLLVIGWNVLYYEFVSPAGEMKSGQNSLKTGMVLNGLILLVAVAAVLPLFSLGIELAAEMDEAFGQMMYSMLRKWYGPEREELESDRIHLDKFNLKIRKGLAPRVAAIASGFALPGNYTLYMVGASSVPYIADPIATWIAAYSSTGLSGYAFFVWSLRVATRWGTVALASILAVRISLPLWKLGLRIRWKGSKQVRWLIVLWTSTVVLAFTSLVWGSVFFSLRQTADDQLLPVRFHGSDEQTEHSVVCHEIMLTFTANAAKVCHAAWETQGIPVKRFGSGAAAAKVVERMARLVELTLEDLQVEFRALNIPAEAPQPNTKRDLLALLEKLVMWQEMPLKELQKDCREMEVSTCSLSGVRLSDAEHRKELLQRCCLGHYLVSWAGQGFPVRRLETMPAALQVVSRVRQLDVMDEPAMRTEFAALGLPPEACKDCTREAMRQLERCSCFGMLSFEGPLAFLQFCRNQECNVYVPADDCDTAHHDIVGAAGITLVISFSLITGAFTFKWFEMTGTVHTVMQVTMCAEGVLWAVAAGFLTKINMIVNNAAVAVGQTIICFGGIFFAVSGLYDGIPGKIISIHYVLAPDTHALFADACPYYGITCVSTACICEGPLSVMLLGPSCLRYSARCCGIARRGQTT